MRRNKQASKQTKKKQKTINDKWKREKRWEGKGSVD
jgi:hypothetical protein